MKREVGPSTASSPLPPEEAFDLLLREYVHTAEQLAVAVGRLDTRRAVLPQLHPTPAKRPRPVATAASALQRQKLRALVRAHLAEVMAAPVAAAPAAPAANDAVRTSARPRPSRLSSMLPPAPRRGRRAASVPKPGASAVATTFRSPALPTRPPAPPPTAQPPAIAPPLTPPPAAVPGLPGPSCQWLGKGVLELRNDVSTLRQAAAPAETRNARACVALEWLADGRVVVLQPRAVLVWERDADGGAESTWRCAAVSRGGVGDHYRGLVSADLDLEAGGGIAAPPRLLAAYGEVGSGGDDGGCSGGAGDAGGAAALFRLDATAVASSSTATGLGRARGRFAPSLQPAGTIHFGAHVHVSAACLVRTFPLLGCAVDGALTLAIGGADGRACSSRLETSAGGQVAATRPEALPAAHDEHPEVGASPVLALHALDGHLGLLVGTHVWGIALWQLPNRQLITIYDFVLAAGAPSTSIKLAPEPPTPVDARRLLAVLDADAAGAPPLVEYQEIDGATAIGFVAVGGALCGPSSTAADLTLPHLLKLSLDGYEDVATYRPPPAAAACSSLPPAPLVALATGGDLLSGLDALGCAYLWRVTSEACLARVGTPPLQAPPPGVLVAGGGAPDGEGVLPVADRPPQFSLRVSPPASDGVAAEIGVLDASGSQLAVVLLLA